MVRLTSGFALEVFERKNARSDRLPAFLSIYLQHFGPQHRTKSNELVEFLGQPPSDRQIVYFGLTFRGLPCGFATFMYYPEGPLGVVDHLVIAPNLRGYGAFFSFCDLIAAFVEQRQLPFDHIAAEVLLNEKNVASTIKPTVLVRLMRLVGFKLAKTNYWAPDPLLVKDPDGCRAALMLLSHPERDELPAAEFLRIATLLYRSHYGRWYQETMSPADFDAYARASEAHLSQIGDVVSRNGRVVLNGMKNFDLHFAVDPNVRPDSSTLIYIALLAVPAVVGVAVAAAQELWVAAISGGVVLALIGTFAALPPLRRVLLRVFRIAE